MNTRMIIKRLAYFIWAMGGLTWHTLENVVLAANKTLIQGEKVYWVYNKSVTQEEAKVVLVNDATKGESYVMPLDEVKKPRKVNKYHLRYQYSARGV